MSILKSPHVNKTAQELFEYRTYSKTLMINPFKIFKTLILLKKIKTNLFQDVKIKIISKINTKIDNKKLFETILNPNESCKNFRSSNRKTKIYLKFYDFYGENLLNFNEIK